MADPVSKGTYSPEPGKVAIRDADGSTWKIPVADLAKAEAEGARPATEAEYQSGQLGAAGTVASTAIGAARGVSLGHSDALYIEGARALAGDESAERVRHTLNLAKEMHPDATTAGEVGGMAVPMFFGGGGLAAGEGGLAARALRAAPRAFGEGAAIGVGQQSSEDALGDHRSNAESYLSAGFKGGAVGVILGSGLHALGGSGSRFGRGLARDADFLGEKEAVTFGDRAAERAGSGKVVYERPVPAETFTPQAPESFAPRGEQLDLGLTGGSAQTEMRFGAPELPKFTRREVHLGDATLNAGLGDSEAAMVGDGPLFTMSEPKKVPGADYQTLMERAQYGGRKGASAERRLAEFPRENVVYSESGPANVRLDAEPVPFEQRFGAPPARDAEQLSLLADGPGQREFGFAPGARPPAGELREPPMFTRPVAEAPVMTPESMAAEIAAGKAVGTPERIQFYKNNAEAIEAELSRIHRAPPPVDPMMVAAEQTIAAEKQPFSTMGMLQNEADRQAFAATGARVPDVRKLGSSAQKQDEAMRRIGATLQKEVAPGAFTTLQDYAEKIAVRTEEVGKSIRPMYAELDKAASRPDLLSIEKRFASEVRGPAMKSNVFGEEELGLAEKALERLAEKGGGQPFFTKLYDLRRSLDDKLATHFSRIPGMASPPGEKAVRALRDIVQDELMAAADRASSELGQPIAARLKTANLLYKDLKTAKDIATKEAGRASGSPAYSASDMLSVVAAMASGSPLGAAIPVANAIRKKFGNQIANHVLRKAANFEAVQSAAERIDSMLNKGTKAVVQDVSSAARAPAKTLTAEEVRQIRTAASNPDAVQSRIAQALGDMPEYAPKTASEFSLAAARTAAYLASQLPKERAPTSPIFTGKTERPMSDTDLRRATAIVEVAKDPSIVLDRMQQGLLTADHVKALKATSPQSFYKIQDYLTRHAAELRPTMTIQQQVSLSILFQKPIAQVMERSNITALQASFVGGDQGPPKGMAPSIAKMAAGPVHGGGTRATTFDMAEKAGRK